MKTEKLTKHSQDYLLSLAIFALIAFGLIMIFSVSKYYSLQITDGVTDKFYLKKQLLSLAVGLVVWAVFQNIDYRFWQKRASQMLLVMFILLLLPLLPFIGGGAGERWINLGFASFQPSEPAKLALIFYLSGWMSSKGNSLEAMKKLFYPFVAIIIVLSFAMLIQKDLGTLSIMIFIAAGMYLTSGAPYYHLALGGGVGIFLLWLAIKLEPYRLERFLTFLNPESNSLGSSYHIRNALIAIGSGGLWGLGFGQSKQKYLYLPESHTDSIFAIISEELGFVRAVLIILLFLFITYRGYKIARTAPDQFSQLVATGITTWFFTQMVVNIAAMLSLVPLTGIPLPFVSYGGTSLIFLMAAVGVLVNISKQNTIFKRSYK